MYYVGQPHVSISELSEIGTTTRAPPTTPRLVDHRKKTTECGVVGSRALALLLLSTKSPSGGVPVPHLRCTPTTKAREASTTASNGLIPPPTTKTTKAMVASEHRPNEDERSSNTVPPQTKAESIKHKRRFCRVEGCTRVIKAQGVCQRHGAKPSVCKVEGCTKQAQGSFNGMCKKHHSELNRTGTVQPVVVAAAAAPVVPVADATTSVYEGVLPSSIRTSEESTEVPPIVYFLREGLTKPIAWHRSEERQARGYPPIKNPSVPLEVWERDLVCTETLLLTGLAEESFEHLAKAWGREPGFHRALTTSVLDRYRIRHESMDLSGEDEAELEPAAMYEGFLKTSLGDLSNFTDVDEDDLVEFSRILSESDHLPFAI